MRLRPILVTSTAVLAAAAVGVGGGYAAGRMDRPSPEPPPNPVALASAAPLPALPELEVAKPVPYAPDIDYPPLPTDLTYVKKTARGAGHTWTFKVPSTWTEYAAGPTDIAGTLRWRPADEPTIGGYLLRILPIQPRDTPQEQAASRKQKMEGAYRDVQVLRVTDDTIWFSYRSEGNLRRFNYFAWVPLPDSNDAGFELSVAGRDADQAGLADLLTTVKDSVRLVR